MEDDLNSVLSGISCCNHCSEEDINRVKENKRILYASYHDGDYSESDGCALVELADGTFAVASEWEDTSGHGCQCDGEILLFANLDDAINLGLTETHRDEYRKANHG